MARNNPTSWGLKIPGRPPTPSEGYAQQYDRIGPALSQKLWTFDNGTCLTYGPDDLVDEFDPVMHPFCNQVALIDTLIRDNIAVRARYEVSKGDTTVVAEDPFDNFRQRHLDPKTLPRVKLASGIYLQVPSRFASVGTLVSVYATPNKSDTPGEAHRGLSNDTRFGMCGKPSYNALSEMVNRQDNIHRLTMQRHIQSGVSRVRGGRGGRGGRQRGQNQRARNPQQFHHQYTEEQQYEQPKYQQSQLNPSKQQPNNQPKYTARGQQKTRGRGGNNRGKGRDPVHRHERFRSQAYTVTDTPISNFVFPVSGHKTGQFPFQDYEDEGPLAATPYGGDYFQGGFHEDMHNPHGYREDSIHQVHEAFDEELGIHPRTSYGIPASSQISQGTFHPTFSKGHVGGNRNSKTGHPPPAPSYQHNHGSALHSLIAGHGNYVEEEDNYGSKGYARFLDEQNERSRARGDPVLAGDRLNVQVSSGHLLSDSWDSVQGIDSARELESRGSPVGNSRSKKGINNSARARRFLRPSNGGSSTRPTSPTIHEGGGRLSAPPRDRPSLLSPLMFGCESYVEGAHSKTFGENPGNMSHDSSSFGGQTRTDEC